MRTNRNLLAVAAGLVGCVVLIWLSTSIQGGERTYEVRPYISVPEYRTDTARAVDAYERLMERYMDLTEGNLFGIDREVGSIAKKLDSIDNKLTQLSRRMARIEKALGIEQPKPPAKKELQPEEARKETQKESLPAM